MKTISRYQPRPWTTSEIRLLTSGLSMDELVLGMNRSRHAIKKQMTKQGVTAK